MAEVVVGQLLNRLIEHAKCESLSVATEYPPAGWLADDAIMTQAEALVKQRLAKDRPDGLRRIIDDCENRLWCALKSISAHRLRDLPADVFDQWVFEHEPQWAEEICRALDERG